MPTITKNRQKETESEVLAGNKKLRILVDISHTIVLLLSLALIVYISYDTFTDMPFLEDHTYMTFQFWVCVVFMTDFIIEFCISKDKRSYLKRRWLFFVISIPYLNIVNLYNFTFTGDILFYLRFVPLLRGAYSLAMVIGYISHNRAVSLMWQYFSILLVLVYSLTLVFYYQEHHINPNVKSFWDALYWALMNTTTVGCYFSAVTPIGKAISVVLPTAGMLMLPLFTAVITSKVRAFDANAVQMEGIFAYSHRMRQQRSQEGSDQSPQTEDSAQSQEEPGEQKET